MIPHHIRQRLARNTKQMSQAMETKIRQVGIKTGSRVFGGFIEGESDVDWILPFHFPLFEYSDMLTYSSHDYHQPDYLSVYTKSKTGEIWNLLVMQNPEIYEVWVETTIAIRRLVARHASIAEALHNKTTRVVLFETLKWTIDPKYSYEEASKAIQIAFMIPEQQWETTDKKKITDDLPF
jgi:hypothetical protein